MKTIKTLMLLLIIISYACKKKTTQEIKPVEEKNFVFRVIYYQDSLDTYYYTPYYVSMYLDNAVRNESSIFSSITSNIILNYTNASTLTYSAIHLPIDQDLTYYINVKVQLSPIGGGSSKTYWLSKKHTFNSGDNGYINFKDL